MSWVTPTRDNQKRITHQRKEGRLLNAASNISYPCGGNKTPSTSIFGYNGSEHSPSGGRPVPEKEVEETMIKLFEPLSEEMSDVDGALVRTSIPAEIHAGRTPSSQTERKTTFQGQGEPTIPNEEETHILCPQFPTDPTCATCRMTKTTRARCKNIPLGRADGPSLAT